MMCRDKFSQLTQSESVTPQQAYTKLSSRDWGVKHEHGYLLQQSGGQHIQTVSLNYLKTYDHHHVMLQTN